MAVKKISKDDLESAIRDTLDADMCIDIVQSACSEHGDFEEYDFMDSRDFFACFGTEYGKIADLISAFYNGTDLDTAEDGADPYADYFRWSNFGIWQYCNGYGNGNRSFTKIAVDYKDSNGNAMVI